MAIRRRCGIRRPRRPRRHPVTGDDGQCPPPPGGVPVGGAAYERTKYEAELDLDFAIRLSELHARMFSRFKRGALLINLIAGSAAFVTLFGSSGLIAGIAGLVVAITSMVDLIWDFGHCAARHQGDREAFLKLRSRQVRLSMEQLDAELDRLRAKAAPTIDALSKPAFNSNLARHSRPECMVSLNAWEKFVDWIA